ncbi:MAG: protein kinase [Archangium sp.]|nr:protein kinase [Archangium sp.]
MIKDFRVVRCLGRGSMGEVYEAKHQSNGKRVAIKLLREGADDHLNASRRLLEEARVVASIRHKGIVDVFDIGLYGEKRPYLVMELLEGLSLSARIRQGPVLTEDAVTWLEGILTALEAAHQAGVIHRDLKPSNVFLTGQREPFKIKLLDFGVARRAGRKEVFTAPSMAVGSVGFMAPEQLQGNASASSDLYAVGCLAFQLFAGRPVFPLKNIPDAARKHMTERPPLLRDVRKEISAELEGWVDHLLRKLPGDRPVSAAVALDALRSLELDPEMTTSRQRTEMVPAFTPPTGRMRSPTALSVATPSGSNNAKSKAGLGPVPAAPPKERTTNVESVEPGESGTDRAKTIFDT